MSQLGSDKLQIQVKHLNMIIILFLFLLQLIIQPLHTTLQFGLLLLYLFYLPAEVIVGGRCDGTGAVSTSKQKTGLVGQVLQNLAESKFDVTWCT